MKKLSVVPLLALLVALVVTGVTLVHPAEQAQAVARAVALAPAVTGVETALGVQIPGRTGSVRSEQSAQGVLADGRYLACFVNSGGPGTPARFFAMDLTGATVAQLAVPVGTDILTVVYSPATRTVLFAANTATASFLYEWDGVTMRQVATIPGQAVMRLAATPDGPVYVGTFAPSDGRLYVYARGVLTDLGQPIAGESYVRSLVADTTSVWVSNYREAGAKLVRVDRATRARTVIAVPAALAGQWSALDMSRAGPYLFLRTVNDPRLFAYDTVAGAFRGFDDQVARVSTAPEVPNPRSYIDGISPYGVSPLLEGRYVYFQRSGAGLMRVDVAAGFKTVRVDRWNAGDNVHPWPASSVPGPVSYAWLSGVGGRVGPSLVTTTIDGRVYVNTPAQTGPLVWSLAAREAPSTIIRVGADPTGTVFTGGFDLPAGVGAYSPASGTTTVLQGPQVEGFGSFGSSTVMGGYTGNSAAAGPLYLYSGTGQPVLRTYLGNGQERPVALAQVGSTVAVGSVPIKNTLGGALSIWDPVSNALTVRRNLIPDHSIISLAASGRLVVGGSSNVGGTGSTPTATSGQVFTYDPASGALKTFTPPRAATATYSWVAAITPDPAAPGRFWALSTGYLIAFQVGADGSITLTRNLGAFANTSSPTGKELGIAIVDGTLFVTVDQGVAAVNPVTGEHTTVATKTGAGPVVGLVRTGPRTLYYARGSALYRYDVTSVATSTSLAAPRVTAPDGSAPVAPGSVVFRGTGTRNSTVEVRSSSRTRSTLVQDDGTWVLAALDFPPGDYPLTFTASMDGFTAQVTSVTLSVRTPGCTGPSPTCLRSRQVSTRMTVPRVTTGPAPPSLTTPRG